MQDLIFEEISNDDDDEEEDLFNNWDELPNELKEIFNSHSSEQGNYESCEKLLKEIEPLGYTFQYGLDGEPFGLKKI